jgi:Aerotolerance regulator N-terminal
VGFLAPWFLAGLAAVGLPVWLHLLKRHRNTPTLFPSIRFFERRTQSSIKHRRLRYLLLFAVRTALVAMLVLAFANPFLRSKNAAESGRKRVVAAIDNSFSMRQGGRLEHAKREALKLNPAQVLAFNSQVQLVDAPQAVQPTDAASSYAELVRSVRSLGAVELHLFSDMQKTSMPANFADLRLPAGVDLISHPVAAQELPNFAVENAVVEGSRVQVTVKSHGTEPATRRVSLSINGKEIAAKPVRVPADGRAAVEFTSVEPPYGASRGEIRIDSGDAFPDDDRFHISLDRGDPRRGLFIHEARETRARLYVAAALDASHDSGVALDSVTVEQASGMSPAKYAFVVLSDVALVPGPFEAELDRYVREGGSVLIALGPAAAQRGRLPILNLSLAAARYSSAETWSGVRFYHAVRMDAKGANVSARLSDSTPLLMEQRVGEGRVMVFASTFDNVSNDFPLHASFVPFIQQTAHRLAGIDRQSRVLSVGDNLDVGRGWMVLDPTGRRPLSLEEASRAQALRLETAGFYDVRRPNGRQELVAVNPDRRESDFAVIPQETMALWRNTGRTAEAGGAAAGERREERRSLAWYALAAALALALLESILANRHLAVNREAA